MSIRRITASLALAVAVVVPIAIAAPAQAGVNPGLITLEVQGGKCVATSTTVIGNPGSAFTVHNKDCGDPRLGYVNVLPTVGTTLERGSRVSDGGSVTFTLGSLDGTILVYFAIGGIPRIAIDITDVPIEDPKPHDYFQQVGVPASGDCADVDPAVGHYPGYPIGGWSKSWAQWINDGTGGAVCTREVEERVDGTIVLVP